MTALAILLPFSPSFLTTPEASGPLQLGWQQKARGTSCATEQEGGRGVTNEGLVERAQVDEHCSKRALLSQAPLEGASRTTVGECTGRNISLFLHHQFALSLLTFVELKDPFATKLPYAHLLLAASPSRQWRKDTSEINRSVSPHWEETLSAEGNGNLGLPR